MQEKVREDKIVLGSGELYVIEYSGESPADEVLEVADNLLGDILGGATLEYKAEFYTATSDLGVVTKTVITKEEASIKTGVITWCQNTLEKLCSTARVSNVGEVKTIKIGGLKNHKGKRYLVRFVQKDIAENTVLRVTIVGVNQNGLTLAFTQGKETQVDAVFKAEKSDTEGTLITIAESPLIAVVAGKKITK